MLGKLMKYEFKACGRTFIPIYLGILILSVINGLFLNFNIIKGNHTIDESAYVDPSGSGVQNIFMLVLLALFVALFVITIVLTIQRFKKNLLEDEGYLMFTLPVKSRNLIISKYLVALIFALLSGIVAVLSFMFIALLSGSISFGDIAQIFSQLNLSGDIIEVSLYFIVALFITYSIFILTIYFAVSIGQLPNLSKHRVAAGFISFFVINFLISYIQSFMSDIMYSSSYSSQITNEISMTFSSFSGLILLINALITVGIFFLVNWILDKKLNLE
ncbi:MAG: ABC transporter permease [Terrisporobacter sp.]|uniref:ABC transporter permease n=1 Tax=Terrisporobacter sp. TaxID=1965305 RepID=UPI002FCC5D46